MQLYSIVTIAELHEPQFLPFLRNQFQLIIIIKIESVLMTLGYKKLEYLEEYRQGVIKKKDQFGH